MHLPAIQTPQGFYTLCEIDEPATLAQNLGLDITVTSNQNLIAELQSQVIKTLSPQSSGVCVDEQTLPLFLKTQSLLQNPNHGEAPGLIIRLDTPNSGSDPLAFPTFSQTWGVEHVANNYALAMLELTYHPNEPLALEKKQLVAELGDFCQSQKIDFMLKLLIGKMNSEPLNHAVFHETQLTAVQELSRNCQLLALEAPFEPLAAATITAELDIPWIMVGSQPEYGQFQDQLLLSLDNGAQGFLAGSILWQEVFQMKRVDVGLDEPAIKELLTQELPQRYAEVVDLTIQTVKV